MSQHNTITLTKRKKSLSPFWELKWSFTKTWVLFIQRYIKPSLVEIGPGILNTRIAISILSFLGKGCGPSFKNKLQSSSMKDTFCQVWLKLAQWFWRRRNFFNFVNVFSIFHHLPSEKVVAFHLYKVESPSGLPPSMHFQSLEKMKM